MSVGPNFSASDALLRAKELAASADFRQERATTTDELIEAQARAATATALATIALAMRQPQS